MREPPVAVAVGAAAPQPLHPAAERHVLRRAAAALPAGQHAVVQLGGGHATQVTAA